MASGHENGDCEQSHRRFKEAVAQALLLRGSRDFASRAEYEQFLRELAQRRNAPRAAALTAELAVLHELPAKRLETQERRRVRVRRGSTIQISYNTYSVPARLIGEYVETRIGVEEIEVWYADTLVQRMPRLRGQNKHQIDYRHIISWLVRKPGAFARYVYRADLYPTVTFRRAYDTLQNQDRARADKDYVQILYLGSGKTHCLAGMAQELIRSGRRVWFTTCNRLVQDLLAAKRDYKLKAMLKRLDRWEGVILDDLGYVQQNREEMEVLFTFLAERYERGSVLLTSNLAFSK